MIKIYSFLLCLSISRSLEITTNPMYSLVISEYIFSIRTKRQSSFHIENSLRWIRLSVFINPYDKVILDITINFYCMKMNKLDSEDIDKRAYFNSESRETYASEQVKNQYSTFIEELEETTEKLMNEVFNVEYKPEIEEDNEKQSRFKANRGVREFNIYEMDSDFKDERFKQFILRNKKWKQLKQQHINAQIKKKQEADARLYRDFPLILRGSREKLDPIYERALQIHESKQKARAFKRIDQKKLEEEKLSQYSFHPRINEKAETRSLQQYLKDKEEWEKRKKESRELKKLKEQAKKYDECTFAPLLVSKQMSSSRMKQGERVEERLLRSLQKVVRS